MVYEVQLYINYLIVIIMIIIIYIIFKLFVYPACVVLRTAELSILDANVVFCNYSVLVLSALLTFL